MRHVLGAETLAVVLGNEAGVELARDELRVRQQRGLERSAGIALAMPGAKMTIVEPDGWDDMGQSLRKGKIVPVPSDAPNTVCDALQTPVVSPLTFEILKDRKAEAVSVSDEEVFRAMRHAHERLRLVLEPGGAVALAAVLSGKVEVDDRTLIILSGGNVDPALFSRALAS
ncbi:pyridoxal-phosphate dependent enzyme [Blastomonas sp. CACIA14H2]|uniref:pyridoxal-phosphate dependent enzyme n=1 Tax=Blastomonas sp. CACIA14H2 TaxID=1419876 RepID=UPI004058E78F